MEKYGLIGNPVGHSFSARYFAEKFAREGVDATYTAHCLDSIEQLPELIRENTELVGLNVTSPFKEACLKYIDRMTPEATRVGAVNTIFIDRTTGSSAPGRVRLIGHNTDVEGFEILLSELQIGTSESAEKHGANEDSGSVRAVVLGSGGAAKAVCVALQNLKIPVTVVSRNPDFVREKFGALCETSESEIGIRFIGYEECLEKVIACSKLIVNATPLGMGAHIGEAPVVPYSAITSNHYCADLIYNPEKTKFLRLCEERGAVIRNGLTMLIGQARASWRFWQSMI